MKERRDVKRFILTRGDLMGKIIGQKIYISIKKNFKKKNYIKNHNPERLKCRNVPSAELTKPM